MKKSIVGAGWLIAITVSLMGAVGANGQPILLDKQVTIQPISVRSGDGSTYVSNSAMELFAAETRAVWAQAGIEVKFNAFQYYDNDLALDVAADASVIRGMGQVLGQTWSGTPNTVIKLFFVRSIGGSSGVLGFTDQSGFNLAVGNVPSPDQQFAIAISDAAFAFNSGNGRRDVVAHELGHALALGGDNGFGDHGWFVGDGLAHNLMVAGNIRNIPATFTDIVPGGNFDLLTGTIGGTNYGSDNGPDAGDQIDRARAMSAVVANSTADSYYTYAAIPEPATMGVVAGLLVLVATGFARRNRAKAVAVQDTRSAA